MSKEPTFEHHDINSLDELHGLVSRVSSNHAAVLHRGVDPVAVVVSPRWFDAARKAMESRPRKKNHSRAERMAGVVPPAEGTPVTLTAEQIEAARTEKGGFTERQLAEWGVPWPPPKDWQEKITRPAGRPASRIAPWGSE